MSSEPPSSTNDMLSGFSALRSFFSNRVSATRLLPLSSIVHFPNGHPLGWSKNYCYWFSIYPWPCTWVVRWLRQLIKKNLKNTNEHKRSTQPLRIDGNGQWFGSFGCPISSHFFSILIKHLLRMKRAATQCNRINCSYSSLHLWCRFDLLLISVFDGF